MFCTNCGAQLPDDAVFCTECGAKMEPDSQGPAKPSIVEKMKGKSFRMMAGGAAAAVIVIAAVGAVFWNQPKRVVERGFLKTWKAVQEESGVAEYLGLNRIIKSVQSGKTRQTLSTKAGLGFLGSEFGNVGFKGTLDKDGSDKMYLNFSGTVGAMNLAEAELYYDKGKILAAVPDLYSRNFCLEIEDLKNQMENGNFQRGMESDFDIYINDSLNGDVIHLKDRYWEHSKDGWQSLQKNAKVKKLGKKSFMIGTKNKSCRGYEVTIPKEDLKNLTDNMGDFLIEEIVPWLLTADGFNGSASYYRSMWERELEADIRNGIRQLCDQAEQAIRDDLVFQVYVGPKGRIVAVEGEWEMTGGVITLSFSGDVRLTGKKNPLDDMSILLEGNAMSLGGVTCEFTRKLEDTKEKLEDTMEARLSAQAVGMVSAGGRASLESVLEKKTGEWQMEGTISVPAFNGNASASGKLENVKKGKSFSFALDDVSVGAYGIGTGGMIDVSLNYAVEPLKSMDTAEIESRKQVDVLKLSYGEWAAIGAEISSNLLGTIPGLWGSSSEMPATAAFAE